MKKLASIIRVGLAALLWLQVVAPYAHLARHALAHHACASPCATATEAHASLHAASPVPHACATCQWMTGHQGVSTEWIPFANAVTLLTQQRITLRAFPLHPAFDFNVAVARGPPDLSPARV